MLGDMLELGEHTVSIREHVRVLRVCVELVEQGRLESLGLVGEIFLQALEFLKRYFASVPSTDSPSLTVSLLYCFRELSVNAGVLGSIAWASTPQGLFRQAKKRLRPGDVVLVKGSRAISMERFTASLGPVV